MPSWIQSNPRKSKNINVNAVMHRTLSFIILKRIKELTLKTKPTVLNTFVSNVHHVYIYKVFYFPSASNKMKMCYQRITDSLNLSNRLCLTWKCTEKKL